jgi:hypothetical protein
MFSTAPPGSAALYMARRFGAAGGKKVRRLTALPSKRCARPCGACHTFWLRRFAALRPLCARCVRRASGLAVTGPPHCLLCATGRPKGGLSVALASAARFAALTRGYGRLKRLKTQSAVALCSGAFMGAAHTPAPAPPLAWRGVAPVTAPGGEL